MAAQQVGDRDTRSLWFNPPDDGEHGRRTLTRERVVAEALTFISADGAQALSMRAIAARLGVVPGALYRHVRSKEQLLDLVLDRVLAEVDCQADPGAPWAAQVAALAFRLRAVLENHPGIATLLKARDPVSPASLALAEAFLAPLRGAGLPGHQAALAFRLVYDYTVGFALGRSHITSRAAAPRYRDQTGTARVPPLPASQPLPHPDRRRHARLGQRPRPALQHGP